jgi:hypothetical protein
MVALSVWQLAWRCLELYRGTWQKAQPAPNLVMKAIGLIPLILLLTVHDHVFVQLSHPALDQVRYGATVDIINKSIFWSFLGILVIAVMQMAWDLGRMGLTAWRKRLAAQ